MSIKIREAEINDLEAITKLLDELAVFEDKSPQDNGLTREKLLRHAFGSQPYISLLVAEEDNIVAGLAIYHFTYSVSAGAPALYLEDLFISENHRHHRMGTLLLSRLAQIALQKECCRMEWHTFSWNTQAISFYTSLNCTFRPDSIPVRMQGEALIELSNFEEGAIQRIK
ncbi:GNAT family acetyltransferase [Legionella birminghamensis]|uniref:GNAT family acetyltransferase n=1 Tax=Legionella birminghamensis TaxID=28083 RepID=A0A378IEV9_9GAMM|nr:GNAT family N-acetyltransferase [Legionella birminghamensis]KTC68767.1 GNAT family acetyltransferase [Legionella birminghamensis]STX33292.1 GNAT family acetyltransferase [Legionella birminghamensis]